MTTTRADNKTPPRKVVSKEDYYMMKAFMVSTRSKDPKTQVGAVIIASNNVPISDGYNGPPPRIPDYDINWDRNGKMPYIKHAEDNAVWFGRLNPLIVGSSMYVTALPCPMCMLTIVRADLKEVIYFPYRPQDPTSSLLDKRSIEESKDIAIKAKLTLKEYVGNMNWIRDKMMDWEDYGIFDGLSPTT